MRFDATRARSFKRTGHWRKLATVLQVLVAEICTSRPRTAATPNWRAWLSALRKSVRLGRARSVDTRQLRLCGEEGFLLHV